MPPPRHNGDLLHALSGIFSTLSPLAQGGDALLLLKRCVYCAAPKARVTARSPATIGPIRRHIKNQFLAASFPFSKESHRSPRFLRKSRIGRWGASRLFSYFKVGGVAPNKTSLTSPHHLTKCVSYLCFFRVLLRLDCTEQWRLSSCLRSISVGDE